MILYVNRPAGSNQRFLIVNEHGLWRQWDGRCVALNANGKGRCRKTGHMSRQGRCQVHPFATTVPTRELHTHAWNASKQRYTLRPRYASLDIRPISRAPRTRRPLFDGPFHEPPLRREHPWTGPRMSERTGPNELARTARSSVAVS